jgi:hypothetical protein
MTARGTRYRNNKFTGAEYGIGITNPLRISLRFRCEIVDLSFIITTQFRYLISRYPRLTLQTQIES